jgi:hypothetical protein
MQAFPDCLGQFHIFLTSSFADWELDLDMHGCNNLCIAELPDMNMVATDYSGKLLNIFLDIVDLDVVWSSL